MKPVIEKALLIFLFILFLSFIFFSEFTEFILILLFGEQNDLLYTRSNLPTLLGEHILMVGVSGILASLTGILLGLYVTRPAGKIYYTQLKSLSSMAQTFPPSAVLALAVPFAGFGFKPVIIALFVYSIFPVVSNTISGIENVKPSLVDASKGMGMTDQQILIRVEIPLAAKVIWAGIRTSTVINIGTATIGAVAGAGGLGRILMAGLIHNNMAYIFTGALSSALLAFFIDRLFALIDNALFKSLK